MNHLPLSGYFRNGLPFNRHGRGPRPLVVFLGLMFSHEPMPGARFARMFSGYGFLDEDYTVFLVNRRPDLRPGCTLQDMSDDYAEMIRAEFGGPVDVIGVSTGGSICLHFAADHPDLLRRLVVHSGAHRLGEAGKALQLRLAEMARAGNWREANAVSMRFLFSRDGKLNPLLRPVIGLGAGLAAAFGAPKDASAFVATVEAEDRMAFQRRLGEIRAPALVAAGEQDPFYTPELFRETAAGIPGARLALYPGVGHPAAGEAFRRDVRAFLGEGREG